MCCQILNRIITDEYGATAIEYALLAALISVAAIGVLTLLGDSLGSMFEIVTAALTGGEGEVAGEVGGGGGDDD